MKHLKSLILAILLFSSSTPLSADNQDGRKTHKWVASWTTAMAGAYTGKELQFIEDSLFYNLHMHPESNLGLVDARAVDQTFRMIIKPDLWGDTIRVRFSNVFGDRDIRLGAASVGLQETAAQLVPETNVSITFAGNAAVVIPKGVQVFSDPIHLPYVSKENKRWLRGRSLAISFALTGKSGLLSAHLAPVYSYFSRPNSGNLVEEERDEKFPFVTKTFFLVSALDVMADADTAVICAFGDSITDGGTTVNGYDGWSDVLSRRLHRIYGDKVSVVNMAIGGNTIVADLGGSPPAVARLDRDILEISGLTSVIWLQGINDLASNRATPDQIVEGIKRTVTRLQSKGIKVTGATLTPSVSPVTPDSPPGSWRRIFAPYHDSRVNDGRKKLNSFILNSGTFDSVVDMSAATESATTGALQEEMHIGDYLHPNRVGHEAMAAAINGDVQRPRVTQLRTEYKENPVGIDARSPRLSWQLRSSARRVRQSAYQIRVADTEAAVGEGRELIFDSGKVSSEQSTQLPYAGAALESRRRYYWQVRVWDEKNRSSPWSETAYWEMGLLSKADWSARWIAPQMELDPKRPTPAPLLRKDFQLQGKIKQARAYVTGLGMYELYLNGKRVGEDLFTPGWTSFDKRIQFQTYDVTALLKSGANAAGMVLGDGWYRRVSYYFYQHRNNGKPLAFLLQLEVKYEDGSIQTLISDEQWKASTGPILWSELYNGEAYDARLERKDWASAGYNDRKWIAVKPAAPISAALIATAGPAVRRIEEIKPERIFTTPAGGTVVDMGQNMVGWIRLRVQGPAGATVKMRHGEVLDPEGNLYIENLRNAAQTVHYTLKGEGEEVFEPHFTSLGFRYVSVEGYPGKLRPNSLTGIVIHSDMPRTGAIETSDERVNQLYRNILWTQKGNYLEVPTDCPQRDERLGMTGSVLPFSPTAALNMNVAGFLTKWLGDLSADQTAEGAVPWEVPRTLFDPLPLSAIMENFTGKPNEDTRLIEAAGIGGAGDAATIVPWDLYLAYGDIGILASQYESMVRWVEFEQGRAGDDHIWENDLHFGDWLDTESTTKPTKLGATSEDLIATAFYAHSVDILQRVATVLNKKEDATRYAVLFEQVREAFRRRFVADNGQVGEGTQTAYVLALDFDLLPEALRQLAARQLADGVRSRGHLTTGILGSARLLNVLSRFGYHDEAYLLFNRREMPSWLYQVKRGATTIWERWDGIKPDGSFQNPEMNSFNHTELGAVGQWMYDVMAGINTDSAAPGYKHSLIQPQPGDGFTYVKGSLDTMYGHLSSEWRIEDGHFTLDIEVPPNTRATVRLPRAKLEQVRESGQALKSAEGIQGTHQEDQSTVVEVGSGRYEFSYPWERTSMQGGIHPRSPRLH